MPRRVIAFHHPADETLPEAAIDDPNVADLAALLIEMEDFERAEALLAGK